MFSWNKQVGYLFLRKFKLHNYQCPRSFQRKVGSFRVQLAQSKQDLLASFALRSEVFQKELRGQKHPSSLDIDTFDATADHLLFWNDKKSELIASLRIIHNPVAKNSSCQQEFYMDRVLTSNYRSKMEFGRLCIHPDYRNSFINSWIWTALGEYALLSGADLLYGIASFRLRSNLEAAKTYLQLVHENFFDVSYFSHPRSPYQLEKLDPWIHFLRQQNSASNIPLQEKMTPLLQSFLEAGGKIVSEPAWDSEYQCLDFLTMIPTQNLFRRALGARRKQESFQTQARENLSLLSS